LAVVTGATIDVEAERAATPGCATVMHLNNAGAALPSEATLEAMIGYLRFEAERGGYEAAVAVADQLAAVRWSAARLLHCQADEVVVTGSDTQAWTKAVWGFFVGGGIGEGQHLLVDRMAYDSHYLGLLQICELVGASIEVVPSLGDGSLDLAALAGLLGAGSGAAAGAGIGGVALVALTHVGTHRGLVNPVTEAGVLCRQAGVPYFLDACQSVGQLPVDVGIIGCDVATATGRKWLRGPRGTGLLFVRSDFADRLRPPGIGWSAAPWEDAGHYRFRDGAERFAEFEVPVAGHLALGVAIEHALHLGLDAIAARVGSLAEQLRYELSSRPGVEVHDGGTLRAGIVTFTIAGRDPAEVVARAGADGINLSVSDAPWARLDMVAPNPTAKVRASPHYYNTEDELARLVAVVDGLDR
jgi:cysteine desulfurase / selenocysteine lyase